MLEIREAHPGRGIVVVRATGYNQEGKTVIEFGRTVMVYEKDHTRGVPHSRVGGQGWAWQRTCA